MPHPRRILWHRILRPLLSLAAITLAAACVPGASAQGNRCGAGKDLIVQALERAGPQASASDFEDALQLLKRASALCSDLGDAWYYRSLVEARLGHAPLAAFAATQARLVGSEAMAAGLQPFTLATPAASSRDFAPAPTSPVTHPASDTPLPAASPIAGALRQKWALVIGIGSFADAAIPSLQYTGADASAFAALLTDPAVGRFPAANVHTLLDSAATTRNIKEQLNWIARSAGPNDMVVIYVATHGSPRGFDSAGGLNYLVTYDTEIGDIGHPDQDALYATALPMVELSSAVATRMKALRTLVVLDTCYSGGSIRQNARMMGGVPNSAPAPRTLQRISQGSGRIVFAASRVDQESLESPALQHGYFTYFLLKALRESKGLSPLTTVYSSIETQVPARLAADGLSPDLQQNPVMERSSASADFALGLTPGQP